MLSPPVLSALLLASNALASPLSASASRSTAVASPSTTAASGAATSDGRGGSPICKRTKVAILGGGTAGIAAAQALSNASVSDFVLVEYNGEIGGRLKHTAFGRRPDGSGQYVIEEGANWVQGIGAPGGPANPIWDLALLARLSNTYSNYSSIRTYTEDGADDFTDLLDQYEDAYGRFEQDAGILLDDNLQDRSARAGLSLAGWNPRRDMKAQASDFWEWDWEYGQAPTVSSQVFGVVNYNTSFYQWSDENNLSVDQRGFSAIVKRQASTFLSENDSRLMLNTIVRNISYSDSGVTVHNSDGSCIQADYAVCTFSLGVLQNAPVQGLTFSPALPSWKQAGIATFSMGTYTKIFLQFPKAFWPTDTQFFLYADPEERGYYPVWQSLDGPGFFPGSGILFVTVVADQAYEAENQDDETTKQEVLNVLRDMFGAENVPEPTAFYYPRWTETPWAYGSYSNWPVGTSLEMHQNLRANVQRLWFAGEATSPEYFGFLQGAFTEGRAVGQAIGDCINGNKTSCQDERNYQTLRGVTPDSEYNMANGWEVSSFANYGENDEM